MFDPKNIIDQLFERAGVKINGSNPWDIRINDDRFYARILRDKSLGLGESYMDGWWECACIDQFIQRILAAELDKSIKNRFYQSLLFAATRLINRQSKSRSYKVAKYHYNLDNNLFSTFLDRYKQYSCAFFNGVDDLDQAQYLKLNLICRKLELCESDKVLDIGSGWGGLAKFMTKHYGCKVTGINISDEQIKFAQNDCQELPVKFVHQDYRNVKEKYDKIVSVGMFEHVGYKNYRKFMDIVHRCLKPHGIFLLHTIGNNETSAYLDPWMEKYIFPNGLLPSIRQIAKAIEGRFVLEDLHNLGPHYDKTLMAWHRNFISAWKNLRSNYSEHFRRMWEYYLLSCAGAFRSRSIQVWQIVMTHVGTRQPKCRYG
jgi:cyclopropane-fatty-acyl-phospholipid synthase